MEYTIQDYIDAWRNCIMGAEKSWVLFENGTCVILMQPENDLAAQAQNLLREYGVVQVGTPSADFNVVTLDNGQGWVVTCHHNDILNFVFLNEGEAITELEIGLIGRSYRAADSEELQVVHIEDNRK